MTTFQKINHEITTTNYPHQTEHHNHAKFSHFNMKFKTNDATSNNGIQYNRNVQQLIDELQEKGTLQKSMWCVCV